MSWTVRKVGKNIYIDPVAKMKGITRTDDRIANAYLIAAAPELLEACVMCLPCIDGDPKFRYETKTLKAALRKAGWRIR